MIVWDDETESYVRRRLKMKDPYLQVSLMNKVNSQKIKTAAKQPKEKKRDKKK